MDRADIIMACICDYAGQVRGKGLLYRDLDKRLRRGIGLAPTNLMITAFGAIVATPWAARGELLVMPDASTEVHVALDGERPDERFILGDLCELDGMPWQCCPRDWLRRALKALESEFGLQLNAAFEHEFHYSGAKPRLGDAYSLDSMRLQGAFAQTVMHALEANGIEPEMVMPEYGPQQFEVTCGPAIGLEAADRAVRLREIVRAIARAHGEKATFSPVMGLGLVGNGVHIHFSLQDVAGRPVTYDPDRPCLIGADAAHFVAGILDAMPSTVALTAPSMISYERLQPNRWSASYNNLADKDREAGVRICPLPTLGDVDPVKSFNLEYRAADATASPYLALGALAWAGLEGLRGKLVLPAPTSGDPGAMPTAAREAAGLRRLPTSLEAALDAFESDARVREWMGQEFRDAYLMHKRSEIALVRDLDPEEQVRRYAEAY